MWNKSVRLFMFRVQVQKHRRLAFPVPVWVVNDFLEALTDLAWVGEQVILHVPVLRDEKSNKHVSWAEACSLIITVTHNIIKDVSRYKGLDIVDVEAGEVRVKISIK